MKMPPLNNAYLDRAITAIENFMSLYLVIGGLQTALSGGVVSTTAIGQILGSEISIILFGLVFFTTGCMLLYATITDNKKLKSKVLMASFCILSFTFFAELALHTGGGDSGSFAILSGLFYLRSKRLEPVAKHVRHTNTM